MDMKPVELGKPVERMKTVPDSKSVGVYRLAESDGRKLIPLDSLQ